MLAWGLIPAEISNTWLFLAIGSVSVMLVSTAKSGFGGSAGILSFPLMVYACGGNALLAAGVMLPLLVVCDYVAIVPWRGQWNFRAVRLLLPGMLIGVLIASAILWGFQRAGQAKPEEGHKALTNAYLILSIGLISLAFVALHVLRSLREKALKFRPVLWQGTCVGAAAGLTSTLAHAAGPIVTMYMLPQQMPKEQFVSSTVLYYWIGNQVKLVPYFALGMLDVGTLGASLVLLPAVIAGTLLGLFLHRRVGARQFQAVVYLLLALAGTQMVMQAARTIWR